ncbi:hypothetical protein [Amedibacterium intestinale]|uniref:hypothetical protein n=1 Tax=Amedibacterium intestinale TaxID=2583452 RepID=UPI000E200F29
MDSKNIYEDILLWVEKNYHKKLKSNSDESIYLRIIKSLVENEFPREPIYNDKEYFFYKCPCCGFEFNKKSFRCEVCGQRFKYNKRK